MQDNLPEELKSFRGLWGGGYYEGDPLQVLSSSTFGAVNFISVLHATYLRCIKPYIHSQTVALEIGPGRGAWTKAMLPAREVWTLDTLPEEENRFYEYLGHPAHVKYIQVTDFQCSMLPDDYFSYMFSFGCFCHVSFQGMREYAVHLFPKLKAGSDCFWMIADREKYNRAFHQMRDLSIWRNLLPKERKYFLPAFFLRLLEKTGPTPRYWDPKTDGIKPGRWRHSGIRETCAMLADIGYEIIDPDVGTNLRDPIIHFRKP
jgi:phospholipid N-methyltransferase